MAKLFCNLAICFIFAEFCFVLVVSAENRTEPAVKNNPELKETCSTNTTNTCHAKNAVCSFGHCLCPLGFIVTDVNGTQSCNTFSCSNSTANATCALFGEASTCASTNTCQCIGPENHIDQVTQECINFKSIQDKCTSDHQCGENFRCNMKKCECKYGFTFDKNLNFCKTEICHKDDDCQHFSTHSKCNNSSCQCESPFELDESSQKCFLKLKSHCTSETDCGKDAKCTSGVCSCPMGYVQESANGFNCKLYTCTNDESCKSMMNTNSTMCRKEKKVCECFPPTKFRLDEKKQECVSIPEPLSCASAKCPSNSECVSGSCHCKVGYYQTEAGQCESFSCNYYVDDCGEVFAHSACSSKKPVNTTCICKPLFKLNEFGTACESEKNLQLAFGVIGVGVISFVGPILFFTIKKMIC